MKSAEVRLAVCREETGNLVAQMRSRGQGLHDHAADGVVADDQRARHADAALMQFADEPQAHGSAKDDQQGDEHPGEDQREPRLSRISDERRSGKEDHDRHTRGSEDCRKIVKRARGAWQAIQPAQPEDEGEHERQGELQRQIPFVLDIITGVQVNHEAHAVARKPGQVEGQVDGADIHRDKREALDGDQDPCAETRPYGDSVGVAQRDALRSYHKGYGSDGRTRRSCHYCPTARS